MNFGSIGIKALVVLVVLFFLSLAGALTFPILAAITNGAAAGQTGILIFLLAIVLLVIVGNLLARGIRSIKGNGQGVLMGFVGALGLGGILAIFAQLNIPYTVQVNLAWAGTNWYSPLLTLLFIGIPLMFVFMIGD